MSGWGQFFVPPIESIVDHEGARSLVLMLFYAAFLCPRLYWPEDVYVGSVIKLFLKLIVHYLSDSVYGN